MKCTLTGKTLPYTKDPKPTAEDPLPRRLGENGTKEAKGSFKGLLSGPSGVPVARHHWSRCRKDQWLRLGYTRASPAVLWLGLTQFRRDASSEEFVALERISH